MVLQGAAASHRCMLRCTPCLLTLYTQQRTLELAQACEVAIAQLLGAGDRPLRPLPELGLEAVQLALQRRQIDACGHGGARRGGRVRGGVPGCRELALVCGTAVAVLVAMAGGPGRAGKWGELLARCPSIQAWAGAASATRVMPAIAHLPPP